MLVEDFNSKKNIKLPHMLVDINSLEEIVSKMGIKKNDEIIIYDNSDVLSACRCWFNFIYFGHNPKLVHVLLVQKNWRGARVADRGSLLRSCAFTGTGGSNPFLSAK